MGPIFMLFMFAAGSAEPTMISQYSTMEECHAQRDAYLDGSLLMGKTEAELHILGPGVKRGAMAMCSEAVPEKMWQDNVLSIFHPEVLKEGGGG